MISGEDFRVVTVLSRGAMALLVFAWRYGPPWHNIETAAENTGVGHVFPNKGGLLAKLEVSWANIFCFTWLFCWQTKSRGKIKTKHGGIQKRWNHDSLYVLRGRSCRIFWSIYVTWLLCRYIKYILCVYGRRRAVFFNHLAFCVCNTLSTILTRICFNMFQMSRSGLFQNKDEIIKSHTRRGLSILSV